MLSLFPMTSRVEITDAFKLTNPIFAELAEATNAAKYKYMMLDNINYANVTDGFKLLYPELVFNKITAEEMAQKLSELALKNK